MTSRDFVYWLQGFFELSDATELTANKTAAIKNHLSLVFVHELDPQEAKEVVEAASEDGLTLENLQKVAEKIGAELQKVHDGSVLPSDQKILRC